LYGANNQIMPWSNVFVLLLLEWMMRIVIIKNQLMDQYKKLAFQTLIDEIILIANSYFLN